MRSIRKVKRLEWGTSINQVFRVSYEIEIARLWACSVVDKNLDLLRMVRDSGKISSLGFVHENKLKRVFQRNTRVKSSSV